MPLDTTQLIDYTQQGKKPDDRTIYFVLDSLMLDLADIQKTVEAFAQVNNHTDQA